MKDRDDFSKETRDRLAMRVGVRCSNPSCRKLTTGPRTESPLIVNIGVAAHITAASLGGPRYDVQLSSEQRRADLNGIWLCQNCAKLIDNDPKRYTAEVLLKWKAAAEKSALAELECGTAVQRMDSSAEIDFYWAHPRITRDGQRHDYCLEVLLTNRGMEPLHPYHIDVTMPALVVSNPEAQPCYVQANSTPDTAFFRVSSSKEQLVYPGDPPKVVVSIPYYVDDHIFWGIYKGCWNRQSFKELCNQSVKVTLYEYGFPPITLERRFGDFQIF